MTLCEVRAYTIKFHGAKVAKTHLHDWVILLILAIIDIILNVISPFRRFVGKDMMIDLKFPLQPNTVPVWAVPIYAVLLPMIIFNIRYFRRRDVHDLHHGILGLLYSVLITGVITDAIKDGVGRPRPNFFRALLSRCGDASEIKEGYKSFPSGHTSWSFAGLGFLALYLSGKIQVFDRKGHAGKLCVVFFPLLMATLVGVSRVDDYWHHWQDVFTGALIGLIISFVCYLQFFPPPHNSKGWGPHSYFRALEEENTHQTGSPTNGMIMALVNQRRDHQITIE